jgi:hypothetical protein
VDRLPYKRTCECATALRYALSTRPEVLPEVVRRELGPFVAKYRTPVSCVHAPGASGVLAGCSVGGACNLQCRMHDTECRVLKKARRFCIRHSAFGILH